MGELQAFQVRFTAKGRDTYGARSSKHDDLAAAVELALMGSPYRSMILGASCMFFLL